MSTHVIFPALGDNKFPATLSEKIMTGFLREELGFTGLTTTDALEMKAISDNYGEQESVILGFLAGCDTLIVPASWQAYDVLLEAARSGRIPEERLNEAVERILAAKKWLYPDGYEETEKEEVLEIFEDTGTKRTLEELALKSVTLLEKKVLPLKAGAVRRIYILQEREDAYVHFPWERAVLKEIEEDVKKREPGAVIRRISRKCTKDEAQEILASARQYQDVVFFCIVKNYASDPYKGRLSKSTNGLLREISHNSNLIMVSLGSPYVIKDIETCAGFLCTYGESELCARTALKVLYGEAAAGGKLPVAISEKYPLGFGLR